MEPYNHQLQNQISPKFSYIDYIFFIWTHGEENLLKFYG